MKTRFGGLLLVLAAAILVAGCSGDGGSGTLSIDIADAKPMLPVDTEHVYITIDEVQAHKAGGDWVSLPMAQTPYTIDLLQFSDGASTQLVPPVELDSGKYTQIRLVLAETGNSLVTAQDVVIPLTVPSGFLRTDKNFDFDVEGAAAVALTVHFDLSRSIVAQGNGSYHLKPVLHLMETQKAASIQGDIAISSFGDETEAVVTVEFEDEVFTQVVVEKPDPVTDPVPFTIFWLVPDESYEVEVEVEGFDTYEEAVDAADLEPGETFVLNGGLHIVLTLTP